MFLDLPLRYAIVQTLLERIQHVRGVRVWSNVDHHAILAEHIRDATGYPCKSGISRPKDFLPLLYTVWYNIDFPGWKLSAGSTSVERDESNIKAQGEVLERVSCHFPLDDIRFLTNPDRLKLLRKKHVVGKSIVTGKKRNFTNEDVYFAFLRTQPEYTTDKTTSGCGGHVTYDQAVLSGLLELIERDAFMVHWLNTVAPPKITVRRSDLISTQGQTLFDKLGKYKISYTLLNITSDVDVPVCLCVIKKPSHTGNRYFLGACAGFDFDSVFIGAVCEAISVCSTQYEKEPYILGQDYTPFDPSSTIDKDDRMHIFFTHDMEHGIQFLFDSTENESVESFITGKSRIEPGSITSPAGQLRYLKELFQVRHERDPRWDVYVCEVKNRLLSKYNYTVVRVLCDGLYPLYLRERFSDPKHPRLEEFAQSIGLTGTVTRNPLPHPFP